jgi:hypothetical protein
VQNLNLNLKARLEPSQGKLNNKFTNMPTWWPKLSRVLHRISELKLNG